MKGEEGSGGGGRRIREHLRVYRYVCEEGLVGWGEGGGEEGVLGPDDTISGKRKPALGHQHKKKCEWRDWKEEVKVQPKLLCKHGVSKKTLCVFFYRHYC